MPDTAAPSVVETSALRAGRGRTPAPPGSAGPDLLTVGRRIRHLRQQQGSTLDEVAGVAGISASALSLIENGKREAKLSVLTAIAAALGTGLGELLAVGRPQPARGLGDRARAGSAGGLLRRAAASRRCDRVRGCRRRRWRRWSGCTGRWRRCRPSGRRRRSTPGGRTPKLRRRMRDQDNYFGDIETLAAGLLQSIGYRGGADHPERWWTGWPGTWASRWCTPRTCRSRPARSPIWRTGRSICRNPMRGSTTRGRWRCRRSGHVVLGHQVPGGLRRLPASSGSR